MDTANLKLHEQLIRFAKGMLKAWEEWLEAKRAKVGADRTAP